MRIRTLVSRRREKAEASRQRQRNKWLRKNRPALDAYNEHVDKHSVFSDGLRSF